MPRLTGSLRPAWRATSNTGRTVKHHQRIAVCCGGTWKNHRADELLAVITHERRYQPAYDDYLVQHLGIAVFTDKPTYELRQQGTVQKMVTLDNGEQLYVWEQREDYEKENLPSVEISDDVPFTNGTGVLINAVYLHGVSLRSYCNCGYRMPADGEYFLFVGTTSQFDQRYMDVLDKENLILEFSTNIHNLNYPAAENPRLAWAVVRGDMDKWNNVYSILEEL